MFPVHNHGTLRDQLDRQMVTLCLQCADGAAVHSELAGRAQQRQSSQQLRCKAVGEPGGLQESADQEVC